MIWIKVRKSWREFRNYEARKWIILISEFSDFFVV